MRLNSYWAYKTKSLCGICIKSPLLYLTTVLWPSYRPVLIKYNTESEFENGSCKEEVESCALL
jgi:hypothetical protein